MAILKIKNSTGEWAPIYAFQGPKGETGATGPKGDTGAAGGVQDVAASSTSGYITVTKSDGTTKDVKVGASGSFLSTTGGTLTGAVTSSSTLKITDTTSSSSTSTGALVVSGGVGVGGSVRANSVYGAVWNDYAEYREANYHIQPGYCVSCDDDGALFLTSHRLQHCEGVVSDTFGFAIGETDAAKTPLAVSGRALVYTYEPRDQFHAGDCVCAGPEGKVSKMTYDEIREYPHRIVGIVSEVPWYNKWGTGEVNVDGRIWIKVK